MRGAALGPPLSAPRWEPFSEPPQLGLGLLVERGVYLRDLLGLH
jgi:hypothetical protein